VIFTQDLSFFTSIPIRSFEVDGNFIATIFANVKCRWKCVLLKGEAILEFN
jgi:hypothetical protein